MGLFSNMRGGAEAATSIRHYELDGEILPVAVKEHARAKRLTLRLDRTGRGLKVTVPPKTSRRPVENFLSRQAGWIATQLVKQPASQEIGSETTIMYEGMLHEIVHHEGRGTTHIRQDVSENAKLRPALHVYAGKSHLKRRVKDFLKRQARQRLLDLSRRHAATLGVSFSKLQIKDTTSRWGSCSSTGTLSYSWRIIMAPPQVLDYLVAHEVSHLVEMNHGPNFWALVEELCPDYQRHRNWLRKNGDKLHAWQFD
jgi:hypothetical protein